MRRAFSCKLFSHEILWWSKPKGRDAPLNAADTPLVASIVLCSRVKSARPAVPGCASASSSRSHVAKEYPLLPE